WDRRPRPFLRGGRVLPGVRGKSTGTGGRGRFPEPRSRSMNRAQPDRTTAGQAGRPTGGEAPPPPTVAYDERKAAGGPGVDFGLFEDKKDKYRDARRQKKMGQLCPACREQKEREQQEAARQRRQEKAKAPKPEAAPPTQRRQPERLPDGARFNVVYDAANQ